MSISADGDTVVITHGGAEGTQLRAAVLDDGGVVTAVVLLPADWATQDPATRYSPGGTVHPLQAGDPAVEPGWRYTNGHWTPPAPEQSATEPTPVPDGTTAYGTVTAAGPPVGVDLSTGEHVAAGRLAGYTPETGHMVKLSRISGQWVVEDRVLLADET